MLFKDRLEIWNPGRLPYGLTPEKLKKPHSSIPANLLLAEPMYLAGYIERIGTGTGDIIRWCKGAGLPKEPEFIQEDFFKIIIWRKDSEVGATGQATGQAVKNSIPEETLRSIRKIVHIIDESSTREELQEALELKGRDNFLKNYLYPAIEFGYVEMTYPNTPNHPGQRYRLTGKGFELKKDPSK